MIIMVILHKIQISTSSDIRSVLDSPASRPVSVTAEQQNSAKPTPLQLHKTRSTGVGGSVERALTRVAE